MEKKVVIFTSPTCTYCHVAKDYFKEKGIEYTERNVGTDESARAELREKKIMGVPAIFIDDEVVIGFDKAKIDELLGL